VHALVTGLDVALRTDVARARDALRAMLGDVQLIEESGAVYAECDNAAERLLLAVGGVSMGRVAGARTQAHTARPKTHPDVTLRGSPRTGSTPGECRAHALSK
jgi:hypothetical protein